MSLPIDTLVKNRFLGFLIWQSILSTSIFLLTKTLFLLPFTPNPLTPSLSGILAFFAFQISQLLFSAAVFVVSSPQADPAASLWELVSGLVSMVFVPGQVVEMDSRRRARVSRGFVIFTSVCAVSGFVSVVSVCWSCGSGLGQIGTVAFRGGVVGLCFGLWYLYYRRWVFVFPIIQRPPFFSFKMGIPSAIARAFKLSSASYLISAALSFFLPYEYRSQITKGKSIVEQIVFYIGCFVVFLCYELSHHLHQVLHTKRFTFAPPKGSAAAETNPSEPLLGALEQSSPRSLLQYLAYLDLCMVCENNVDTWRRAAFFEETGETYKKVVSVCLRPLEQLTERLGEGLESCSADNPIQLHHQLRSPTDKKGLCQPFYDFQLCAWCARIVASLTVRSHREDRFGVAQLSGSNASVMSTLLSCLLAVETSMGKKTNLQPPQFLMGPASIKWATVNTGRKDAAVGVLGKRKDSVQYSKAYSMADIVRTSIYCIVSAFQDEMLNSSKTGLFHKDWITTSKPLYGTHDLLLQKLRLFLDIRAS